MVLDMDIAQRCNMRGALLSLLVIKGTAPSHLLADSDPFIIYSDRNRHQMTFGVSTGALSSVRIL